MKIYHTLFECCNNINAANTAKKSYSIGYKKTWTVTLRVLALKQALTESKNNLQFKRKVFQSFPEMGRE